MPNWVEGKLKIRGKLEDIKRWVEECLHCYTTNWLGDGAHTELVEGAVRFEHDPDSEEMYLYVDKSAHIEGTRRNFVEKGEYVDFCEEGKKSILVVNMKAAWNIEEQPYIEMSKKYNLDFRVYGYEMGMDNNTKGCLRLNGPRTEQKHLQVLQMQCPNNGDRKTENER